MQNLNNILTPIAEQGPTQQGFGGSELSALNTEATQGVGQNYAKASQVLNNTLASQGGGNEFLPNGAQAALKGNLAASAANQSSNAQLGITTANYATGRQNWQNATAGLNALAGQYNPAQFGGLASNANEGAFKEESQIRDMQNQEQAEIAGGVASLATDALSFGMGGFGNLDTTGGSSGGEQIGNFFSGGLKALGGNGNS